MRSLLLAAALLAAVLPGALGHATLPLNGVQNGGFEAGLAGWSVWGSPTLTSPGAEGSANALLVQNRVTGSYAHQALPATLGVGAQGVLLDFSARILGGSSHGGLSVVETLTAWNPVTGAGQFTAWVAFREDAVHLAVWTTDPLGDAVSVPMPTDGAWHHYQVVEVGLLGVGELLIDGTPVATAVGDPASVGAPDRIIVGDVACCDQHGPAPTMAYDEIWHGVTLPPV